MGKWKGKNREKPKGIGSKPESGNRWEPMRRRNTRKRLLLPQGAAKVKDPSRERDGKGVSQHGIEAEEHPLMRRGIAPLYNNCLGVEKCFPGGI